MAKDMEKYHKLEKEIKRLGEKGYKKEEAFKIAKEKILHKKA
jgi:hypothetical protein